MKRFNINFIKMVRYKETIKQPKPEDWDTIMTAIMILIKLKVIEEEGDREGLLNYASERKPSLSQLIS